MVVYMVRLLSKGSRRLPHRPGSVPLKFPESLPAPGTLQEGLPVFGVVPEPVEPWFDDPEPVEPDDLRGDDDPEPEPDEER
jgi:hypothetical protein